MSTPTFIARPPRSRRGRPRRSARQVNCAACSEPSATRSSSRRASGLANRGGDRGGIVGSARTAAGPAGLVHRRVRRGDHRHAARHRLRDRHPEALEAGRVDDDGGAAIEPRRAPRRRRTRAGRRSGPSSSVWSPQPEPPATASRTSSPSRRCASTSVCQVLARLERGDGEHVRPAEVGALARRARTPPSRRGRRPSSARAATPSRSTTSRPVYAELTKTRSQVRAVSAYLAPCIVRVFVGHPLGEANRHEVVHRRRPHAAALRRIHPVGEVEDVERAEQALERRLPEPAPGVAPARARTAAARA